MPYDSLGCVTVFEAVKRNIKIYAVKENKTALNITSEKLGLKRYITEVSTYEECLNLVKC